MAVDEAVAALIAELAEADPFVPEPPPEAAATWTAAQVRAWFDGGLPPSALGASAPQSPPLLTPAQARAPPPPPPQQQQRRPPFLRAAYPAAADVLTARPRECGAGARALSATRCGGVFALVPRPGAARARAASPRAIVVAAAARPAREAR